MVTSINGSAVKDPRDLAVRSRGSPQHRGQGRLVRDSKRQTASITLGRLRDRTASRRSAPDSQDSERGPQTSRLGIAVAPASRVMGIGTQGLAVLRIDPTGTAAEAGLAQGDVILKVGAREMQSAQDLTSALDEAARHSKHTCWPSCSATIAPCSWPCRSARDIRLHPV